MESGVSSGNLVTRPAEMNPAPQNNETPAKRKFRWVLWTVLFYLAGPYLLIPWLKPEWLGRLIGVTSACLAANALLFIYGFHPKSEFLYSKSKIARMGSERTKQNAHRFIRGLVILSSFSWLYLMTIPIGKGCISVSTHGRGQLLEIKGRVVENKMMFGFFFLQQSILISKEGEHLAPGNLTAMYFPRLARQGETYWFLIEPKSRVVLDWQAPSASENPPIWK